MANALPMVWMLLPPIATQNSTTSLAFLNLGNDLQVLIRHTFTAFVRLFMSVKLGLLFEPVSMHHRLSVLGSSSHLVRKGPSSAGFILEWEYGDDRVGAEKRRRMGSEKVCKQRGSRNLIRLLNDDDFKCYCHRGNQPILPTTRRL